MLVKAIEKSSIFYKEFKKALSFVLHTKKSFDIYIFDH